MLNINNVGVEEELVFVLTLGHDPVVGTVVDLLPGAEDDHVLVVVDDNLHVRVVGVVDWKNGIALESEQEGGKFPVLGLEGEFTLGTCVTRPRFWCCIFFVKTFFERLNTFIILFLLRMTINSFIFFKKIFQSFSPF